MLKDDYFRVLLGTLAVLGALHFLGTAFYWYWQISFFDNIVHFLGGFWVGGMLLWFLVRYLVVGSSLSAFQAIVVSILYGFLVGFAWEYFELFIGATSFAEELYIFDTVTDVLIDTLGAALSGFLYTYYERKNIA